MTESAITGLRAFYSGVPIFGTAVALFIMRKYDIIKERAGDIRAKLEARKADSAAA